MKGKQKPGRSLTQPGVEGSTEQEALVAAVKSVDAVLPHGPALLCLQPRSLSHVYLTWSASAARNRNHLRLPEKRIFLGGCRGLPEQRGFLSKQTAQQTGARRREERMVSSGLCPGADQRLRTQGFASLLSQALFPGRKG